MNANGPWDKGVDMMVPLTVGRNFAKPFFTVFSSSESSITSSSKFQAKEMNIDAIDPTTKT